MPFYKNIEAEECLKINDLFLKDVCHRVLLPAGWL